MSPSRLALLVVVLCACDPVWRYQVHVKSPTNEPVADAAAEATCTHSGRLRATTDARGEALLSGLGSTYPPECTIKVSKPGYADQQFTFDEACGGDRAHCKTTSRDVVLVPVAGPPPAPAPSP